MMFRAPLPRRRPGVFNLHRRDVSFGNLGLDPAITFRASGTVENIWASTCRIVRPGGPDDCLGTGFFTSGTGEGDVVVTNAHVVDRCPRIHVEWIEDSEIVNWPATLIAIDYTHDLAILKPDPSLPGPSLPSPERVTFPAGLQMGEPPHPGDDLLLAGYPHGVQTPRVARALASGYDIYRAYGSEVVAVMLDGNVNPGNSGGPVCNADQRVVGVVAALRPNPLFPTDNVDQLSDEMRQVLEELCRHLSAVSGTGIGYAIHPIHVKRMLSTLQDLPDRAREPHEKIAPEFQVMRRDDFIALQRHGASVRGEEISPIGVFSADDDGTFYAGWSTGVRFTAERNDAWRSIAPAIRAVGRNFILRGYDIVAYRPKRPPYRYGYWAVAVRLQISD